MNHTFTKHVFFNQLVLTTYEILFSEIWAVLRPPIPDTRNFIWVVFPFFSFLLTTYDVHFPRILDSHRLSIPGTDIIIWVVVLLFIKREVFIHICIKLSPN